MRLITVFACESQPIAIEGLRLALEASAELLLVGAADPEEALPRLGQTRPDVVLLGPAEESAAVLRYLERLRAVYPGARVVLWVRQPEALDVRRASELGVHAVLRRALPAGVLRECLATVGRGGHWRETDHQPIPSVSRAATRLTRREREVLGLLCRGLKNKQIAQALAIAPGTVKVHLMHIFEKTGACSRYELAINARRLVGPEAAPPCGPHEHGE